jgi:hypothetical protein
MTQTGISSEQAESQAGYEDSAGGPGAPTPLTALEVRTRTMSSFRAAG